MKRLTLDQRAQRRATRINNQLRKSHPLLADLLATTPEEERRNLQEADRKATQHLDRIAAHRHETAKRAQDTRALVALLVTPEELEDLDRRRQIYPSSPEYSADFWTRTLKALGATK